MLSAAYFVGELLVPNISGTTITEKANLYPLQVCIAKYEPLYLIELLGEDLYTAYAAGIVAVSPLAKWTNLRDKIYIENNDVDCGFSPAANYVYFYWRRQSATVTLLNAESKAGAENFTADSPMEKMVAAWNEMVRMSDDIQTWIRENVATYPEYTTSQHTEFETINTFGF